MEQPKLFAPSVTHVHLMLRYYDYDGWRLSVVSKRGGQLWMDAERDVYEKLSAGEALQLAEDVLLARLIPEIELRDPPPF